MTVTNPPYLCALYSLDPARNPDAVELVSSVFVEEMIHLAGVQPAQRGRQGEGSAGGRVWDGDHDIFHPDRDEVAHYYRFEELKLGRRYRRGDTPQSGPHRRRNPRHVRPEGRRSRLRER